MDDILRLIKKGSRLTLDKVMAEKLGLRNAEAEYFGLSKWFKDSIYFFLHYHVIFLDTEALHCPHNLGLHRGLSIEEETQDSRIRGHGFFFSLFFVLKLSFIFIMDAALCLMGCAGLSQSLIEDCVQKGDYQNWKRLLETSFCPFANQQ